MFTGNQPTRVDKKGRLKVPAAFKRVIDEKYGTEFYITSLDGKVAQVYPLEEWRRIEHRLSFAKKQFYDRVNYYGEAVKMDGRNRLLIPQLLREAAQLNGEVAVTGNLTHLIVRNVEAFRTEERPSDPDSAAPVPSPLKPKPHLRSGAIALAELTHPDDGFTEMRAKRIPK